MKSMSLVTATAVGAVLFVLTSACGSSDNAKATGGSVSAQAYAQALCNRVQRCSSFTLQQEFGDVTTCVNDLNTTISQGLALPGVTVTNAELEACANAAGAAACDEDAESVAACRLAGSLAAGAACSGSVQCASAYCQLPDATSAAPTAGSVGCGKCVARSANGGPCVEDEGCDVGSACDDNTHVCTPRPAAGAACTKDGVACQSGSVCFNNVCSPPVAIGGACDDDAQNCVINAVCQDSKCIDATSLFSLAEVGQPCGIDETAEKEIECKYSSCVGAQGAQKCVAFAAEGAACNDDSTATAQTLPDCAPGLGCDAGKCVKEVVATCQ